MGDVGYMRQINPSTSRRQQQFMCAEYGRKKIGQRTQTGMSKRQLKEFCQRRKNVPAILQKTRLRQLIWKAMDKYGISLAAAVRYVQQHLARDPEWELLKDNIKVGVAHMRGKNPKKRRCKNPHLRSGKWQFLGMFEKRDIKQVKRILRVHGMKMKVTTDHYKREPGMRELYVERGAFATAYRAIASLFVSEKSMVA